MTKKKVAFLYSTREGQTLKILQRIELQFPGDQCVEYHDLHDSNALSKLDLANYQYVLVAASIRYGRFNKRLYTFIERYLPQLEEKSASFICVNLTARKEAEGKDTPEGSAYIKTFLKKSPWQPSDIAVFAGALRYPRYRWFDRTMIRFIMSLTGGETDITQEFEYTNWQKVELYANCWVKKLKL